MELIDKNMMSEVYISGKILSCFNLVALHLFLLIWHHGESLLSETEIIGFRIFENFVFN